MSLAPVGERPSIPCPLTHTNTRQEACNTFTPSLPTEGIAIRLWWRCVRPRPDPGRADPRMSSPGSRNSAALSRILGRNNFDRPGCAVGAEPHVPSRHGGERIDGQHTLPHRAALCDVEQRGHGRAARSASPGSSRRATGVVQVSPDLPSRGGGSGWQGQALGRALPGGAHPQARTRGAAAQCRAGSAASGRSRSAGRRTRACTAEGANAASEDTCTILKYREAP